MQYRKLPSILWSVSSTCYTPVRVRENGLGHTTNAVRGFEQQAGINREPYFIGNVPVSNSNPFLRQEERNPVWSSPWTFLGVFLYNCLLKCMELGQSAKDRCIFITGAPCWLESAKLSTQLFNDFAFCVLSSKVRFFITVFFSSTPLCIHIFRISFFRLVY